MFASSRNHDPSSFAQVLRQRRPRQRKPELPGGASPSSKLVPGLSSISPPGAPAIADLGETTTDLPTALLMRAAPTAHGTSKTKMSSLGAVSSGYTASVPTSQPTSPPVLQDLGPPPWTTRSLRLVHPAAPRKRRASHGTDTPTDGSAGRNVHMPRKRARTSEPGVKGSQTGGHTAETGEPITCVSSLSGLVKGHSCGLCSRPVSDQPRQQCQTCPDVHFCLRCSINSAVLHPGHAFELVEPLMRTTSGPHQEEHDDMRLTPSRSSVYSDGIFAQTQPHQKQARLSDEIDTKAAGTVAEDASGQNPEVCDDEEARQMRRTVIRIPLCKACQTRLFDLRYECQDCPDTNFCSSCRLLQVGHTLKVVTSPVIVSSSDKSGHGGANDEDCAVIQEGAGEAGDAPASTRSRREGHKRHDASLEQLSIEHVSDDHGPDDADEGAGSGIDAFPRSSKECRRIEVRSKSRESPPTQPDSFYQDFSKITKTMAKTMKRMQAVVHAAEHIMRTRPARNVSSRRTPKTHDRKRSRQKTSGARTSSLVPRHKALLDFPIDFATLDSEDGEHEELDVEERGSDKVEDDDDDDEEAEREGTDSGSGSDDSDSNGGSDSGRRNTRPRRSSGHRLRLWTSRERRRLAQLKQKGWNDDRIGVALSRTASAVAQQWRKQKLSAV